jgi:hypothetical protein
MRKGNRTVFPGNSVVLRCCVTNSGYMILSYTYYVRHDLFLS